MKVSKAVTGEYDGKAAIWLEDAEGNTKVIAYFIDEDSYMDFLNCIEAGYFKPDNKKLPDDLLKDMNTGNSFEKLT